MNLTIVRETGRFLGRPVVRLACSCGAQSMTVLEELENLARAELEHHWAAEHRGELLELGLGPCVSCGTVTDHVRMHTGDGVLFVCPNHAPDQRMRELLGDGPGGGGG